MLRVLAGPALPRAPSTLLASLGVLLAVCMAGCSDEPSAAPTAGSTPETPSVLVGLLELIPPPPDGGYWNSVYLNDYGRMREAHGIQAPENDATGVHLEEYLSRVFEETGTTGPWLSGYHPLAREEAPDEKEYLRFDIDSVDSSIWVDDPPRTLEAMTGRFDPEATGGWLAACAGCPEPEMLEHGGIEFYSWGEDSMPDPPKRLQPPAFDQLGRGGRIAVLDSHVFRTVETEGMRYLIDSHLDNRDSLADDPDMALAAGALDGLGVYSALLFGDVESLGESSLCDRIIMDNCPEEEALEKLRSQLGIAPAGALDRYILLGAGVGHDGDGFYTVLVFVYESEDVAERNVGAFKEMLAEGRSMFTGQTWTEYFPQSEVLNDGRALIASLRPGTKSTWERLVHEGASLLIWRE